MWVVTFPLALFSEEDRASKDVMAEQSKLGDWSNRDPHHRDALAEIAILCKSRILFLSKAGRLLRN